jgi:hypothetical protein
MNTEIQYISSTTKPVFNNEINVSEVVYREDLYPRIKSDPATIQKYADNIEVLPPIEVNQNNILIDGFHRWTAYKKLGKDKIPAIVTVTQSENEILALAIERNAAHGLQLSNQDKKEMAVKLYGSGAVKDLAKLQQILSIGKSTLYSCLDNLLKEEREKEKRLIFDLHMKAYSQDEIGKLLDKPQRTVSDVIQSLADFPNLEKSLKVNATFQDADFDTPLYNVWNFLKVSNNVNHFGKSEQRILERLLYLYTQPFDIVVDPFAGGASTLDVCLKRLRRCWIGDRKPIIEREKDIRKHDIITDGLPGLNGRWSDVSLVYLDPPYWKQAEGIYSNDPTDLANMDKKQFTSELVKLVKGLAGKLKPGSHIALLIQPTQWNAPEHEYTDHIMDVLFCLNGEKKLKVINRVSCPYSSQQCNPQMVNYAKDNKMLLVLSRELIIWQVVG